MSESNAPPLPGAEAVKSEEEQQDIEEHVRKCKASAERLVRQSVDYALHIIEREFIKEFSDGAKTLRLALISSIRRATAQAVDAIVVNMKPSINKQV